MTVKHATVAVSKTENGTMGGYTAALSGAEAFSQDSGGCGFPASERPGREDRLRRN